ncbi:MAG TPA: hypothetical protein VJ180_04420 [Pyrinomonadaceae bacterium]|nr:hypothetical protein [Pyrinomonadaceae bacterium]
MNRNQKIALGCGAAGCLGLILAVVVGAIAYYALQSGFTNSNRNTRINVNRNSPEQADTTPSNDDSDVATSSSMSDDDKHKLFQAAALTQDTAVIQRVWRRLGLAEADGTPNDQYTQFMKDHVTWLFSNTDFMQSVNTPEKARAYVDEHIND